MTQASEISGVVALVPRKPGSNGHGPPIVIQEEEPAAIRKYSVVAPKVVPLKPLPLGKQRGIGG